jgi:hypothetical protein
MKSTTHLESFGSMAFYGQLINLVRLDKYQWRKVSRFLNKIRRQLHPWPHIDRNVQLDVAYQSAVQSLKDTKLPDEIKSLLKKGLEYEFQFKFNA